MTKRILTLALCLILALCALTAAALADEEPVELTICTVRRTTDITSSYSENPLSACSAPPTGIKLLTTTIPATRSATASSSMPARAS